MQTFRILHFRDFVLEKTQALEGIDLLEAIEKASAARAPEVTVEIWSDKGRVGTVEPPPAQLQAGIAPWSRSHRRMTER